MPPLEVLSAARELIQRGGEVLWLITGATFLLWLLIGERFWYFARVHPARVRLVLSEWQARSERTSWYARQIRRELVARIHADLVWSLGTIRTLVAICPLLGLLGTVTGMIEVFEVMALAGSGNARAMAAGISKATIPTMAGMVAALSGLYASAWLERRARYEVARAAHDFTEH